MERESPSEAALGIQVLHDHLEEAILEGCRRTLEIPSYAGLTLAELLPRVTAGFQALLHDAEHPPDHRFGDIFGIIGKQRALEHFRIVDVVSVIALTEEILEKLLAKYLEDASARLAATLRVHAVCFGAMSAIIEAFGEVNAALLRTSETLVEQLSSPLLPIYQGIIVMPLIGAIDEARSMRIMEALLSGIVRHRAEAAILDVTGIAAVDATVAGHLLGAARAGALLGAQIIIAGLSPDIAQELVREQFDMSSVTTLRNLQTALEHALRRRGLSISRGVPGRSR